MICTDYQGNKHDLDGLIISANISQNGKAIDYQVEAQDVNGKICFEMLDSFYVPQKLVSIMINVSSSEKALANNQQILDVGDFQLVPFLRWIYGAISINTKNSRFGLPNPQSHWGAYDLSPSSPEYPDGLGAPVYAPCNAEVLVSEILDNKNHRIIFFCTQTGYYINRGHFENNIKTNDVVLAGQEIGNLIMESGLGYPHVHFQLIAPNRIPITKSCNGDIFMDCARPVDPFLPALLLEGENPLTGFWLPSYLPEQTALFIESGTMNYPAASGRGIAPLK